MFVNINKQLLPGKKGSPNKLVYFGNIRITAQRKEWIIMLELAESGHPARA
jgi:hypothetical protein